MTGKTFIIMKNRTVFIFCGVALFLVVCIITCKKTTSSHDKDAEISTYTNDSITDFPVYKPEEKSVPKVSPEEIEKMKSRFKFKKDEFDPNGHTWVNHKSEPAFLNQNAVYCYFQETNNNASNLRFKLQYAADDWLFIEKCQFLIDGKAYEYYPSNAEKDNDSTIWEWFDESVNESNKDIVKALADAKEAKVKLIDRQHYDIMPISKKYLKSIHETVELYEAMGGTYH